MKKIVLLALIAFAFMASSTTGRAEGPIPTCHPCPFVR
jgi:hypothetical protein